jgi:hypothetical protein
MYKLLKLLKRVSNEQEFIEQALKWMKWYQLPIEWTKRDLIEFYRTNGGIV